MYKTLILSAAIFLSAVVQAEIIEIQHIDEVRPYIKENTLCLFDIDDTLIDNPFSLGGSPWRNWVKAKLPKYNVNFVLYDALTQYIAKMAPYKSVEDGTVKLINDLQEQGTAVFAFTARGRTQWYTTDMDNVDRFTHYQLNTVGIDFNLTQIPEELRALESAYFYKGIIFAQHIAKGDLLKHLFKDLHYSPPLIVFVDDKLEQVQSVEKVIGECGIPVIGFWYRRSELDRANFNPTIANIQLDYLLQTGEIVSDEHAAQLAKDLNADEPQKYLKDILDRIDVYSLTPNLPEELLVD